MQFKNTISFLQPQMSEIPTVFNFWQGDELTRLIYFSYKFLKIFGQCGVIQFLSEEAKCKCNNCGCWEDVILVSRIYLIFDPLIHQLVRADYIIRKFSCTTIS